MNDTQPLEISRRRCVQALGGGLGAVALSAMLSEQASADRKRLIEAGFDMHDVGAVAARSGPPVGVEDECAALVPAGAGMAGRVPVSADTFQAETARRALEAAPGARGCGVDRDADGVG